MSYVNLMGQVRWTEDQHTARTEAIIANQLPPAKERILTRRTLGFLIYVLAQVLPEGHPLKPALASMGRPLSPEEAVELATVAALFVQAEAEGDQARADWAVLERVLAAESGAAELAEDDAEARELMAVRAAARPAEEPADNEGNNDAPVDPVGPDSP